MRIDDVGALGRAPYREVAVRVACIVEALFAVFGDELVALVAGRQVDGVVSGERLVE
jgi:hypothetical protein